RVRARATTARPTTAAVRRASPFVFMNVSLLVRDSVHRQGCASAGRRGLPPCDGAVTKWLRRLAELAAGALQKQPRDEARHEDEGDQNEGGRPPPRAPRA